MTARHPFIERSEGGAVHSPQKTLWKRLARTRAQKRYAMAMTRWMHRTALWGSCFSLVGCAMGEQLPLAQIESPGQRVFNGYDTEANCYSCHDGTGRGNPDLARRIPDMTDAEVLRAINKGPGHMPSYEKKLSVHEKQQLVAWLRAEFGGSGSPESRAAAEGADPS